MDAFTKEIFNGKLQFFVQCFYLNFNTLQVNISLLYPLKASENLSFCLLCPWTKQEVNWTNIWVKEFKNGPTKICGRQPFRKLKRYGLPKPKQTISPQTFYRLSSTNFTWSILEYFDRLTFRKYPENIMNVLFTLKTCYIALLSLLLNFMSVPWRT